MKTLVIYVCASTGDEGGEGRTRGTVSSESLMSSLATSGSCGLCAYVEEPETPLKQFFRGLREVTGRDKDTSSHVMKLGRAPSAWVLGPGLGVDQAASDLERDVGVAIRQGLHDVYRETSVECVGRRVSSLLSGDGGVPDGGDGGDGDPSKGGRSTSEKEIIYALLVGGMPVAEQLVSHLNPTLVDDAFVTLVVERPGYDVSELVNRHASCSFRPPQSFSSRGSTAVRVRNDLVSTVVYRGPRNPPPLTNAVTRVDGVTGLEDVELVYAEGCGKCVLAERVLFEVAYKIGWSDKFGS